MRKSQRVKRRPERVIRGRTNRRIASVPCSKEEYQALQFVATARRLRGVGPVLRELSIKDALALYRQLKKIERT